MNFVLGRKIVIGIIYIAIAIAGMFIFSPYVSDGKIALIDFNQLLQVIGTVLGITIVAKLVQKVNTSKLAPPVYITFLEAIQKLLVTSGGFAYTIGSSLILCVLYYFGAVDFDGWFYGYSTLIIVYDTVNVVTKKKIPTKLDI